MSLRSLSLLVFISLLLQLLLQASRLIRFMSHGGPYLLESLVSLILSVPMLLFFLMVWRRSRPTSSARKFTQEDSLQ